MITWPICVLVVSTCSVLSFTLTVLRDAADFERSIEGKRRIGIEHDVLALVARKPAACTSNS